MSEINYQALREIAKKATQGEWVAFISPGKYGTYAVHTPGDNHHGDIVDWPGFDEQKNAENNARYIAAFNPEVVQALLDERERNQQYIKRRDQENEDIALTVGKLRVELEAAEKRIAELEAEPVSQTYKLNELSGNYPVTPDGWISCSERMPAQDDWILIYSKHGEYMAGQVQGEYVELSDGTLSWLGNALYWMPLPEPPQEAPVEGSIKAAAYATGWNACRAAMLQGGQPVNQTYNLPELIEGMEVSIDVSTCDADLGNRYFGTVTEALELDTAKNGYILLVQDAEPNFDVNSNSPVTPDGWISCSERTPESIPGSCKEYLVFDALNNKVHHDYWVVPDGDSAPVASFWNHYGAHVTHWMPLPEPPQEAK